MRCSARTVAWRVMAGSIAASALLAGAGCRPTDADAGRLTVYSAGPRDLAERIAAAFTDATGIEVDLFVATTGQVMAKLEAERFNARADVVLLASALAADGLRDAGRLLPHVPAALADASRQGGQADGHHDGQQDGWHDPRGFHHAPAASAVGIALRRDAIADDDALATLDWADALAGRFGTRAVMPSPARSGSSGDFVLSYSLAHGETAWELFRAARRSGMEISGANAQAITSLRLGAHDAIVGAVDYLIFREIARGEPFVMHFPRSGVPIVPRPAAILASTRRAGQARRFIDFLFTDEMQETFAAARMLTALDTPPGAIRAAGAAPRPMPIDRARALEQQRQVLRRFQYQVERAAIVR